MTGRLLHCFFPYAYPLPVRGVNCGVSDTVFPGFSRLLSVPVHKIVANLFHLAGVSYLGSARQRGLDWSSKQKRETIRGRSFLSGETFERSHTLG